MSSTRILALAAIAPAAIGCTTPAPAAFMDGGATIERSELGDTDYVADRAVVCFDDDAAAEKLMDRFGLTATGELNGCRIVTTPGDAADTIFDLRQEAGVRMVEPDVIWQPMSVGSSSADPDMDRQWHLDAIGAPAAWELGATGEGVVVAVIDSGVSTDGIDTPALVEGYDFVDDDHDASDDLSVDDMSHGTHVAGTIAQPLNGHSGTGIAPDARIMPLRVCSPECTSVAIASAINYATEHGADVINLSIGGIGPSRTVAASIRAANAAGIVVVAASGNDHEGTVSYPAAFDNVLAVGATRMDGQRATYSNWGDKLDLVAPAGQCVIRGVRGYVRYDADGDGVPDCTIQESSVRATDWLNDFFGTVTDGYEGPEGWGLVYSEGTSMASPQVAAVAALLVGMGADRTQVEEILIASATELDQAGWTAELGHGEVNAEAAVRMAREVYGLGTPDAGALEVSEAGDSPDADTEEGDTGSAGMGRENSSAGGGKSGCSSTGRGPGGLGMLVLAVLGMVARRQVR